MAMHCQMNPGSTLAGGSAVCAARLSEQNRKHCWLHACASHPSPAAFQSDHEIIDGIVELEETEIRLKAEAQLVGRRVENFDLS